MRHYVRSLSEALWRNQPITDRNDCGFFNAVFEPWNYFESSMHKSMVLLWLYRVSITNEHLFVIIELFVLSIIFSWLNEWKRLLDKQRSATFFQFCSWTMMAKKFECCCKRVYGMNIWKEAWNNVFILFYIGNVTMCSVNMKSSAWFSRKLVRNYAGPKKCESERFLAEMREWIRVWKSVSFVLWSPGRD